tara:strand:- start:213 stop:1475 length:1263 start_codon:yes stop_codon:yes gene_type:complete
MINSRLYLQICFIVFSSLLGFALVATIAWTIIGQDQYDEQLFVKTAALSELLVPRATEPEDVQQAAIDKIGHYLDIDLSLYSSEKLLIASVGTVTRLDDVPLAEGEWRQTEAGTRWATKLTDGRQLVINVNRIALPGESAVFVIFLIISALGISAIMYPFIRSFTGRIERLQLAVRQIGFGDLSARVEPEGSDEIAALASSFNSTAERIEVLVNAQKLLLANASHELRTPLTRIRLGIEMIKTVDDDARQLALAQDVQELRVLIDELVLMTRIDAGVVQQDFEVFDLMGVIAEECARYSNCDVKGSPVSMYGDARLIQHLIRNLVDNAFKYGGTPVVVDVQLNTESVNLIVSDGGDGIPEADQASMFEPFQRGRGKQNISGSGLGLSLVQKITDAHRGTIKLSSGSLSAVTIRLPLDLRT